MKKNPYFVALICAMTMTVLLLLALKQVGPATILAVAEGLAGVLLVLLPADE